MNKPFKEVPIGGLVEEHSGCMPVPLKKVNETSATEAGGFFKGQGSYSYSPDQIVNDVTDQYPEYCD